MPCSFGVNARRFSRGFSLSDEKIFFPLLFLVFLVLRFHPVLWNFWSGDDPQILKQAISYQPWEHFFHPRVWREFSASNFTPWVIFSFYADWKVFGLDCFGFYLHHLISMYILGIAAYAVLRLWFSRLLSVAGVVMFAASPPFTESARLLMMRHYIEGMAFSLLCVYLFVRAVREDNSGLGLLAAFFYLLSGLAKEIYLPMIFLLLLLPEKSLRDRLRMSFPCFVCAFVYVVLRWFMLGRLLGGYRPGFAWPEDAFLFFPRVADAMGGGPGGGMMIWWKWLIGFSFLLGAALLGRYGKRTLWFLLLASPLFLMPVVPFSAIMLPRYVWLLVFAWCLLHIMLWERMLKKRSMLSLAGVFLWAGILIAAFFYASGIRLQHAQEDTIRQSVEGTFFLRQGTKADLLIGPAAPGWHFEGLSWLRRHVLHTAEGPTVTYDIALLCSEKLLGNRYNKAWRFDSQKGVLIAEDTAKFCGEARGEVLNNIKEGAPLSLVIRYADSFVSWEFEPYTDGSYALLFGEMAESISPLPPRGKGFIYLNRSLRVRLRYSSSEGWATYSPLLDLEIKDDRGGISWKR